MYAIWKVKTNIVCFGLFIVTEMFGARVKITSLNNLSFWTGRTDKCMPAGLILQNCRIKASKGLDIVKTQSYLGRPWKYLSRVVVMESFIDTVINSTGWMEWKGDFALNTLYYAEYGNTGPRSSTANRVKWRGFHVIGWKQALQFTPGRFIGANSWVPRRQIPYVSGLIKRN